MIFLELFITFFLIGAFTFGGGYAMLPLIQQEVMNKGWMAEEQILNFIAVSESTPGPFAINIATYVGSVMGGESVWESVLGAFCATLGVVLPSFIIILIIASIIKGLLKFAGVQAFLKGIRPVVVGLITGTAITMFLTVILSLETVYSTIYFDWKALVIFTIVATTNIIYKKLRKKNISVIILIILSAILGMLFYGVL